MEVNGQLIFLATLLQYSVPQYPSGSRLGGPQIGLPRCGNWEIFCLSRRFTPTSGLTTPKSSQCTDWTTLSSNLDVLVKPYFAVSVSIGPEVIILRVATQRLLSKKIGWPATKN